MKSLKWFNNKINQRIHRDKGSCGCHTCKEVAREGLVVADKDHAEYLYMLQNEFANCGEYLNYRDKL